MCNVLVVLIKKVFVNDEILIIFGVGIDIEDCVVIGCYVVLYGVYLSVVDYILSK